MSILLTPQGDSARSAEFSRLSAAHMQGRAELRELGGAPLDEQGSLEADLALRLEINARRLAEVQASLARGIVVVPAEQSDKVAVGSFHRRFDGRTFYGCTSGG